MKSIIFVRHTNNLQPGLDVGKVPTDGPINDLGIKQAHEIKGFLDKYEFNVIFTSLYLRSIQTADIINERKKVPQYMSNAFNEYFLRPDGSGVESLGMGTTRTMTKIYSMFDQYDSILIVGHSSINQTMLQCMLNLDYEESRKYFNPFGETQVLRYDWKLGDTKWKILDSFIPNQA